ncbi:MAG: hypothetical protein ACXWT3_05595 [Methylococcaceae bacterium]
MVPGSILFTAARGADYVSGGSENDTIYGGLGSDMLEGGDGADSLYDNREYYYLRRYQH